MIPISNNEGNKWSLKTMADAFGLLCAISSFAFIVAFEVSRCMFEYTVSLSKLLQGFYAGSNGSVVHIDNVCPPLVGLPRSRLA